NRDVKNYSGEDGIDPAPVAFLLEDQSGLMWGGTQRGLYRFDGARWQLWSDRRGLADGRLLTGFLDKQGVLVVITSTGVYRYSVAQERFELLQPYQGGMAALAEDHAGTLWVTDGVFGFHQLGVSSAGSLHSPRGHGARLLFDRTGTLWVGTAGQGL